MNGRDTLLIKRYPNRRLYDTSAGRYVNLANLAEAVRRGADVRVVDSKTGEDLTRLVLTQIIVEDARSAPAALPIEVLRQLIAASDHAGREFLSWYLTSAFEAYKKVQSSVESRLNEMRSAALSPLNVMKNLLNSPADDELAQLRQRIAELESRLEKPPRRKQRKK